jgi:integrase
MSIASARYQQGTIERVTRAKGPDVWIFRWREMQDGVRVQRKKVVGSVAKYKTKSTALKAVDNFRAQVNGKQARIGEMTVSELWGHFQLHELRNDTVDRSPVTVETYLDNCKLYIVPRWGTVCLNDVDAPEVEDWLKSLKSKKGKPLAPATKSKIRNQFSCLFSHAIRYKFWMQLNPIASVRQGSKRQAIPDILTLAEIGIILAGLSDPIHRIAVLIAAVTGLRRSEIRGLKWCDVDFDRLWLRLERGVVRNLLTKLKTEGSRKGVPIPQDLADELSAWREQSCYRADGDWVLASATVNGRSPVWLDIVLRTYIHPIAKAAGITKTIGWHTFRRSLASLLASKGEHVKVVQELLRHSNPQITMELYQQADIDQKRTAQGHVSGLFVLPKAG